MYRLELACEDLDFECLARICRMYSRDPLAAMLLLEDYLAKNGVRCLLGYDMPTAVECEVIRVKDVEGVSLRLHYDSRISCVHIAYIRGALYCIPVPCSGSGSPAATAGAEDTVPAAAEDNGAARGEGEAGEGALLVRPGEETLGAKPLEAIDSRD